MERTTEHPGHKGGLLAYSAVYVALLVLTGVTVGVARIDLGTWNIVVALLVASVKAALVVMIFMHLKDHAATNRAYFLIGFLFVGLLAGLTVADVATRLPFSRAAYPAYWQTAPR